MPGLVNPLLGLLHVSLSIYDSYKTLKYPSPSSARRAEETGDAFSKRALTQRKRKMKGILCVWAVWGVLHVYERTVESIVSLFVPFYESFKTLILLFILLTRTRGAEPVYLHVIRPLVKPYVPTLDLALDLYNMIGGILSATLRIPL
ncbi:hypothetical protein DL96DRAFT_1459556, partial [Flagelloscypha sp. PMI_526]